ncbi:homocysteine S-methyltransferase [Plantibacter flavus]|uniref:homocysteine S-methyltransferase n=1 Tax=Plantibacter flavus TaxID=150123 RepID=UPI003F1660C0
MDLNRGWWTVDGGLGTLLEARGHDLSDELWSARLLVSDPAAIQAAHEDFFAAGAQIAISASYQVGFEPFARIGITPAETDQLLRASVELVRAARSSAVASSTSAAPLLVAASIGPYGATLGDGSEYRGDSGLSRAELRRWHERRLGVLVDAAPDLLALETVPTLDEATALMDLVRGSGVPAWLSFTVEAGRLRSGELMEEGFRLANGVDEVQAVGINCSHPREVLPAIVAARAVTDRAIVVYPNSGEVWDGAARAWRGASGAGDVRAWSNAGATLIGGCCRVLPPAITAVRAELEAADVDERRAR